MIINCFEFKSIKMLINLSLYSSHKKYLGIKYKIIKMCFSRKEKTMIYLIFLWIMPVYVCISE